MELIISVPLVINGEKPFIFGIDGGRCLENALHQRT